MDAAPHAADGVRYSLSVTGTGVVVGLVGVVAVVAGLRGGSPALAAAGGLGLAMLLVSFLLRPSMGWGVVLDPPPRAVAREAVEHEGVLTLSGRASSPPAVLLVHTDGYAAATLSVPPMAPGEVRDVRLVQVPQRRGRTRWVDLTLTTDAPFGLVRRTVRARRPLAAVVHPSPEDALPLPAGGGAGDLASGAPDRRGTDFHALRDLRPGDAVRDVHWRSTAKRGTPVVVERERTTGDDVVVVLAGPSGAPGTDRAWERLVASAAWSLATAVDAGRRGRMLLPDPVVPGALRDVDTSSSLAVLDALALVETVGPLGRDDVLALARRTAAGTGVVVFAPRDVADEVRGWVVEAFAREGRPATVVTA